MAEHATRERYGGSYGPEWEPGDPLWVHPHRDYLNDNTQAVRYMYDVLPDEDCGRWKSLEAQCFTCPRCLVAWAMGRFCWVCGAEGDPPGVFHRPAA